MLAQMDDIFEETCETVFNLNQDDATRYWCEAREEGQRIQRTYEHQLANANEALAEKDEVIAKKDEVIAEMQAEIMALRARLGENEKRSSFPFR